MRQVIAGFLVVGGAALCVLGTVGSARSLYPILQLTKEHHEMQKQVALHSIDSREYTELAISRNKIGERLGGKWAQLVLWAIALAYGVLLISLGRRMRRNAREIPPKEPTREDNAEKEEA